MSVLTRIKICGLTREADVAAAIEAGADAIGFVLDRIMLALQTLGDFSARR